MKIVILGLSITSSWGNGHATNYRALVRALSARGHEVCFLERDVPWYAEHRDLPKPPFGTTHLYTSVDELKTEHSSAVTEADLVIVGSYVPEGVEVGEWVTRIATGATAFFDIDTPVTLEKLAAGDEEYLSAELIPRYDLYLSFTGGPTLDHLENVYGSPRALPFYCMVDPTDYFPEDNEIRWDLGYLGTYSDDRQPTLERLMIDAARAEPSTRHVVAGPGYPAGIEWPPNVDWIDHLPPSKHRGFYNSQRFTLNVTRRQMIEWGASPSVRLFEAAACGTAIISDMWPGLDEFFVLGEELLVARTPEDTLRYLQHVDDDERIEIGRRAHERVLAEHTAEQRVEQLEEYLADLAASLR